MAKVSVWTGASLRELRESSGMSRKDFAAYLNVSPVSVEKWEQNPERAIRPKYHSLLGSLKGQKLAGVTAAALLTPGLAVPALLGGELLRVFDFLSDEGLKESIQKLEALKKLSPEERLTLMKLWSKMQEK